MALQTISGGLWIPRPVSGNQNATPQINTDSVVTTTGGVAVIFRIPKTGTVSKLAFLLVTVTTAGLTDARLETVDTTTGNPTGTLYATGSNATFTPAAGWNTITIGTPAAVTGGDYAALVVKATGATISLTSGFMVGAAGALEGILPYHARLASGTWSKRLTRPILGLEYNDGSYPAIPDTYAVSAVTQTAYNNGSAADEYALKFKIPFPARCSGFWCVVEPAGDLDVVLYDSDGTSVLKSLSFDKDIKAAANNGFMSATWASGSALLANTSYYLSFKPTSATSITLPRFTFPSSAVMEAMDGGANFHEATRVDAGSWTPNTTGRPIAGLLFDQFDDGVQIAVPHNFASVG